MTARGMTLGLIVGTVLGALAVSVSLHTAPRLRAANNDRYGDYVLVTGAASMNPTDPTDAVWLLDYRAGKLLSTVVDRQTGRVVGWAEADLTAEFGLAARQEVHFLMTTGNIALGQSALYVAEVTTGKFGVYTIGANGNGGGLAIRRHDMASFRAKGNRPAGVPVPAAGFNAPPQPGVNPNAPAPGDRVPVPIQQLPGKPLPGPKVPAPKQ